MRAPIKLPSYPFQAESHWRESDLTRRLRMGKSSSSSVGKSARDRQAVWSATLDAAGLTLPRSIIGSATRSIFPGAGYVEMALAAARETFGSGPCVVENIEFQKFLFSMKPSGTLAQVVLDPSSSEFEIHLAQQRH